MVPHLPWSAVSPRLLLGATAGAVALLTLFAGCGGDSRSITGPASSEGAPPVAIVNQSNVLAYAGVFDEWQTLRVWTNKDDYVPGEMVLMLGTGFEPGERVVLTLREDPAVHEDRQFEVTTDTLGAFAYDGFSPESHHVGVAFVLTAVGQTSGRQAETTFTDDIIPGNAQTNHNGDPAVAQITLARPTTVVAGHFMIAQIVIEGFGENHVICTPAGWSALDRLNRSTSVASQVFYRTAGASEPVSWTWQLRTSDGSCGTANNTVTGKGAVGGIIGYSGVHSSDPIFGEARADGSSTTINAPTAIPNVPAGSRVIRYFGNDKEFAISATAANVTQAYTARRNKSGGGFEKPTGAAGHGEQLALGNPTAVTGSNGGNGGNWIAHTVVLRAAPAVTHQLSVTRDGAGSGTVTSDPAGINCGSTCSASFNEGATVTLTAVAATGSTFTGWSGAGTTVDGKRVVTMSEARSVTATFALQSYALNVIIAGSAGTVTSSPAGIDCENDCSEEYTHGTEVTLTAAAGAGSTFAGWSGGGTTNQSGQRVVTMDQAHTVTATFSLNAYQLTVEKAGNGSGSVTSSPTGIDCGVDCSASFDHNTTATLTAVADEGSTFAGWSGAGTTNAGGQRVVEMTQARSVTATFTQNTYLLTVDIVGSGGGSVSSNPAGISCGADCTESYAHGTQVTLTATASVGWTFAGWSGAGSTNAEGKRVVEMTQARSVTATFTQNAYTLTVNVVGSGSVSSNPAGISCGADCTEDYAHGTSVRLSATANAGWTFAGWSGAGTDDGADRVVSMTQARSVTATFTQNTYMLTVNVVGSGSGSVTSNPAGISCGADCTESYAHGTQVTLTPTADAGSTFAGWSGAGTDGANNTRIVEMTAASTVTATFNTTSVADLVGPVVTSLLVSPSPVSLNSQFSIAATIDDTQTGNSNIAAVQLSIDGGANWMTGTPTVNPALNSAPVVSATWNRTEQVSAVFNVCVRGQDAAGNWGNASCTIHVVFDPDGGFVTGGGWINSPAGASTAFPEAVGRANFGFVSKYQKGRNNSMELTGQTQFQFQAGNLNFHSTAYEWLVISGARAQYKGTGTINGVPGYGFILTAIDGDVSGGGGFDRFRIKITNGTDVVYDNQRGESDDSALTNPGTLVQGSVVIHEVKGSAGGKK